MTYTLSKQKALLLRVLAILLAKLERGHFKLSCEITKQEILTGLNTGSFIESINELELNGIISQLMGEGVINCHYGYLPTFASISETYGATRSILEEVYTINYFTLKSKVDNMADRFNKPEIIRIKSKLDEKKDKIKPILEELKNKIKNKENEKAIHKFIKEKGLLPYKNTNYELKIGAKNRLDFLIQNEYGEYELWELKGPKEKLFSGKPKAGEQYYTQLKKLRKSIILNKAIEQILVYKKWLIDHCTDEKEHTLKNHIYNAKLVIIIGSSEEFENEIFKDRLNLERYAYHNLNIITYEMLYEKIEKYFKALIEE